MAEDLECVFGYIAQCRKCSGGVRFLRCSHRRRTVKAWLAAVEGAGLLVRRRINGDLAEWPGDEMLALGMCRCHKNERSDAELGIDPPLRSVLPSLEVIACAS